MTVLLTILGILYVSALIGFRKAYIRRRDEIENDKWNGVSK